MRNTFEDEVIRFSKAFDAFRDKRIILYGIGRKTATLTAAKCGFNFTALLDRDPDNIGKKMYGLYVISIDDAERYGDIIVINAPTTYWETIYKRIENRTVLPVYYLNGEKATINYDAEDTHNDYWKLNFHDAKKAIDKHDVVTFDLFDTLIGRIVQNPTDVFYLVSDILKSLYPSIQFDYYVIRNKAVQSLKRNYSFNGLMKKIQEQTGIEDSIMQSIAEIELNTERRLLRARKRIQQLLDYATDNKKTVYIISDMYLPASVLWQWLKEMGTNIPIDNMIISCEAGAEKKDGSLWCMFREKVGSAKVIHFGDDPISDVAQARKYGVDSIKIFSSHSISEISSLKNLSSAPQNIYQSILAGFIETELFGDDPFCLSETKGKVIISTTEELGYVYFGGVIACFCLWLRSMGVKRKVDHLYFFSRDGYLLQKDYDYLCDFIKEKSPESHYLYTSRRIAYIGAIDDRCSLEEWVAFPFRGSYKDYFYSRFSLMIDDLEQNNEVEMPHDKDKIIKMMSEKKDISKQVEKNLKNEKECYIQYLLSELKGAFAFVDIGYHGNIQNRIGKMLGNSTVGFYFYCDNDPNNTNLINSVLFGCFQNENDFDGSNSCLRQTPQFLESVFTAPYGMVLRVDSNGRRECGRCGKNQISFNKREEINEGIKKYIQDLFTLIDGISYTKPFIDKFIDNRQFVDQLYGIVFRGSSLGDDIIPLLFWEDDIVKKDEKPIFK